MYIYIYLSVLNDRQVYISLNNIYIYIHNVYAKHTLVPTCIYIYIDIDMHIYIYIQVYIHTYRCVLSKHVFWN